MKPVTTLPIPNELARRAWIETNGLALAPCASSTHEALLATVEQLGMVQLDPLKVVARAHHHILWSRHGGYRPRHFDLLLEKRRSVFEHFTHDAAILPMSLWPWWSRARGLRAERYARSVWGQALPAPRERDAIVARIANEGPVCSRDFERGAENVDRRLHAWMRPGHKLALEYLWLSGVLAVSHRHGFAKYYDLVERVIPASIREELRGDDEQIDHLCRMALDRLGIATPGELQRFWNACSAAEVRQWITAHPEAWVPVNVEGVDGSWRHAIACADIEQRLAALPAPSSRVRIVNPFDPLVRDRNRVSRLFGFDYRIEIYVPPQKRRYGYYVYPVLQGTRFIGRIELRTDSDAGRLCVRSWWPEDRVRLSHSRFARLESELVRIARFAGLDAIDPPSSTSTP